MRLLSCLMCMVATAPMAQTADWRAHVAEVVDGFETAALAEQSVPFQMERESPVIRSALASSLGMTDEIYESSALAGYEYAASVSEVTALHLDRAQLVYGEGDGISWAVLPYEIQIEMQGFAGLPAMCNILAIFGTPDDSYVAVLGYPPTDAIIADAMPLTEQMMASAGECNPVLN